MDLIQMIVLGSIVATALVSVMVAISLRRVVNTNEVHIVQSSKKTTSYGKDTTNGNTYYQWPASLPVLGVNRIILPVSVFDLDLPAYEAYDKGRLPFVVDVKAFFRISDPNMAAARVSNFVELHNQLKAVVQGAVRTILASNDIHDIMQGRSKFGKEFTEEVAVQLKEWGVTTVKSIELMDIRDHKDSNVIRNIMEKKRSHIEMESRTEVAQNKRIAEIAEIEARKEVDLQKQITTQAVNLRTIEAQREVELQTEAKVQAVKEQQKTTKEKDMNVLRVEQLRRAEIDREVKTLQAQQARDIALVNAEGVKQTTLLVAEGQLESKKREAEGISLEGKARADAEREKLLAPVEAQTKLAKEIGSNESYQKYLITIKQVEATQAVGIEQAKALAQADIKVISNSGNPVSGVNSVMDLFSSKGGTEAGAMLEALAQLPAGQRLLDKMVGKSEKALE